MREAIFLEEARIEPSIIATPHSFGNLLPVTGPEVGVKRLGTRISQEVQVAGV